MKLIGTSESIKVTNTEPQRVDFPLTSELGIDAYELYTFRPAMRNDVTGRLNACYAWSSAGNPDSDDCNVYGCGSPTVNCLTRLYLLLVFVPDSCGNGIIFISIYLSIYFRSFLFI